MGKMHGMAKRRTSLYSLLDFFVNQCSALNSSRAAKNDADFLALGCVATQPTSATHIRASAEPVGCIFLKENSLLDLIVQSVRLFFNQCSALNSSRAAKNADFLALGCVATQPTSATHIRASAEPV